MVRWPFLWSDKTNIVLAMFQLYEWTDIRIIVAICRDYPWRGVCFSHEEKHTDAFAKDADRLCRRSDGCRLGVVAVDTFNRDDR